MVMKQAVLDMVARCLSSPHSVAGPCKVPGTRPKSLTAGTGKTPHSPGHGVGHLKIAVVFQLEQCDVGAEQGPVLSLVGVARQTEDKPFPLKLHGWR